MALEAQMEELGRLRRWLGEAWLAVQPDWDDAVAHGFQEEHVTPFLELLDAFPHPLEDLDAALAAAQGVLQEGRG